MKFKYNLPGTIITESGKSSNEATPSPSSHDQGGLLPKYSVGQVTPSRMQFGVELHVNLAVKVLTW